MRLLKKVAYERIERSLSLRLYPLKDDMRDYYQKNKAYPTDISEFENWKSLPASIRDECEFVGNKNVYRLEKGKLLKVHLRAVRPWKNNWPFGEETIQVLTEKNDRAYANGKRVLFSDLLFANVPPENIVELETPIPQEFFIRQVFGKDVLLEEETRREARDSAPETTNAP